MALVEFGVWSLTCTTKQKKKRAEVRDREDASRWAGRRGSGGMGISRNTDASTAQDREARYTPAREKHKRRLRASIVSLISTC